jgi:hypothetical protein
MSKLPLSQALTSKAVIASASTVSLAVSAYLIWKMNKKFDRMFDFNGENIIETEHFPIDHASRSPSKSLSPDTLSHPPKAVYVILGWGGARRAHLRRFKEAIQEISCQTIISPCSSPSSLANASTSPDQSSSPSPDSPSVVASIPYITIISFIHPMTQFISLKQSSFHIHQILSQLLGEASSKNGGLFTKSSDQTPSIPLFFLITSNNGSGVFG